MLAHLRSSLASFGAARRNRNLALLVGAYVGTCMASWAGGIAISVYGFKEAGPSAVGVFFAIRLIPAGILSPFAGTLADRYPRIRIMVLSDVLSAVAMLGTAALIAAKAPVAVVFAAAILRGLMSMPFAPARGALAPSLATTPEELTSANVASGVVESTSVFVGPGVAGLLLSATSYQTTLCVVAGAFLWSALLVSRIRAPAPEPAEAQDAPAGFFAETVGGVRTVVADPTLRVVVGLFIAQFLVNGLINVITLDLAIRALGTGSGGVGTLMSAVGVGGLVGLIPTLGLAGTQRLTPTFAAGLCLWSVPLALIALSLHTGWVLVMLFAVGVGTALADVAGITLVQRSAPPDALGRVFGMLEGGILLMLGLGAIFAPLLINAFGLRAAIVVSGTWLPVVVALTLPALRRADARAASALRSADVELLTAIPIFAPLPAFTVEGLAADLVTEDVAAGETIVIQGEPGDRFYVIAEGRVEVLIDGDPVRVQEAGEWFGEIALLGESARTATVRAVTDVSLLSLAGDRFVAAVTGHAVSRDAADAVVAQRLAAARPEQLGSLA